MGTPDEWVTIRNDFLPISQHDFRIKTSSNVFNVILHFLFSAISSSDSCERHFINFIIAQVASFPGKYTTECRTLGSVLFGLQTWRFNLKEFSSVEVCNSSKNTFRFQAYPSHSSESFRFSLRTSSLHQCSS